MTTFEIIGWVSGGISIIALLVAGVIAVFDSTDAVFDSTDK